MSGTHLKGTLRSHEGWGPHINGACKVIVVDTRHEVVIKTWKTSTNNRSFSISKEPTAGYFLKSKYMQLARWKYRKTYY